jgi:hypothetical protein
MTIKQQGGIFGRNPTFNDVTSSKSVVDNITIDGNTISTTNTNGALVLEPNGSAPVTINATQPRVRLIDTDASGTPEAEISASGGDLILTADRDNEKSDTLIRFLIDGGEKWQINSTGNFVVSNSGNGIDFSATSGTGTSELFSDYEEGTYTVSLHDDPSAGNASSTTTTGYYTKVGRVVTCSFDDLNNISTAGMTTSVVLYMSLPFSAAQHASGSMAIGVVDARQTAGQGYVVPIVQSGNSRVRFYGCESGSAIVNIRPAELTSGTSDFRNFTMTYIAS